MLERQKKKKDALHLKHTCKAIHKVQTDCIWTSTVRPETVSRKKKKKRQASIWDGAHLQRMKSAPFWIITMWSCPRVFGNCQKSAAASAIFPSQAFLFSLITLKLYPWSSLLSLGAASSAGAFLLKARNLQLIHLHVSPKHVFMSVSIFQPRGCSLASCAIKGPALLLFLPGSYSLCLISPS